MTHIRNKDTPWKHRYHILKFYWIHSGKRGRRTCTEYAVEKKSAFLTWKKQTYPFTRWKQHQSSSHFLHKTGIEGRKSNFSTVMLFFKKQHTRTQNTQYIKKGKLHISPYKICLCIIYLRTILPPWKALTSFNCYCIFNI